MIGRLLAAFGVFRKGREFVHAGRWKNAAFASEAAALLVAASAVGQAFGWIDTAISEDAALKIAVGVYAAAGVLSGIVHFGSSAKVGFGQAEEPAEVAEYVTADPPPFPCPLPDRPQQPRAPPADVGIDPASAARRVPDSSGRLPDTPPADYRPGSRPGDDAGVDNLAGRSA